jgi:hypothetical protein
VNPSACSRGRRPWPFSAGPVAGVADPGPRSSSAATTFAHGSCWVGRIVSAIVILFIVSCANFAPPPAITPALIANARPDHASAKDLATGRNLFVSRCLECHTLPSVTKHSSDEWPHLVNRMSGRANLSVGEQAAIVAYLRAASASAR